MNLRFSWECYLFKESNYLSSKK